MPTWLQSLFDHSVPISTLILRQVAGFVLGGIVAYIYAQTKSPNGSEEKSLVPTLVLLTILISMVTSVIGDNIARAFALVGALSIVRFRTVVEDTRDTAFVIFAVAVGMAVGTSHLELALISIPIVGLAAYLLKRRPTTDRYQITIRVDSNTDIEGALLPKLREYFSEMDQRSVSTARQGTALELVANCTIAPGATAPDVLRALMSNGTALAVDLHRI